ncbi:MAG: right-handed parallel beta-helix repeat-containing protein, partial [Pirellulaceae bacterium]|nr:right-handed parallel beta-helix repeat-containing protein [Pirellulaceae bacterium]
MSNVREFGAVGDGVNDDTQAIAHALRDGDGPLYFPRGDYAVTRTINVPLDKTGRFGVDGDAGAATIIMQGAGPALRIIGTHQGTGEPGTVQPNVWSKQRMPTIRNIEITGRHAEADGIEFIETMQLVMEGVLIRQVRNGVRLHRRNRNVLISHCHIYHNTGVGVFLDAVNLHQINIASSHISYNRRGGIRIEGSEVRNLQITGNDIEYNNHRSFGAEPERTAEILIDTTAERASVAEVTVASNTIQATPSPDGCNLRIIEQPGDGRPPGLWSITGNIIGNQENNVRLTGCHGVVLSGNFIYSAGQQNLLVEQSSQINITGNSFRRHTPKLGTGVRLVDSRDCVLSGCTIQDESAEGQASGASLLELENCQRITVQGVQLLDGAPYGVDARDCRQTNITGCTIADTRAERKGKAAVRFRGAGSDNTVAHCTLGEYATAIEK